MAKTNIKTKLRTYEGARAVKITPYQQLRRSVCSCLLGENSFYEDGESRTNRIKELIPKCTFEEVSNLAIEAREDFKLRHVPLLLCSELLQYGIGDIAGTIEKVIQRPDELTELLAIYWGNGKTPIANQLKKGIAKAFLNFNEYQFAKYNRDADIKLRDAMFLCHPKPKTKQQVELFRKIANNELSIPDTWETNLSSGKDKKETFERLLNENKLGALALLRNLRNMESSGVDRKLIKSSILNMNTSRILPFRFIAASKYAPSFEPELEVSMMKCLKSFDKINGNTAILIDHSGSMKSPISEKSELKRFDVAGAVAMMVRELCTGDCRVFTFSEDCIEVAPRKGFAMLAAVREVVNPTWTKLGRAVNYVYDKFPECRRIIVITDEQSADKPKKPNGRGYIINVESYQNGIGYGDWVTINGFSEAVIQWINEYEKL